MCLGFGNRMSVAEAEIAKVRPYQDYSIARKAEVIELVNLNGGNVLQTARETGIPHQTIRVWLQTPDRFTELQNRTQKELDVKLNKTVHKLIDSISDHDLTDVPLSQKSTAFGIVFDKLQLLRGQPTSITENIERQELTLVLNDALADVIDVSPE